MSLNALIVIIIVAGVVIAVAAVVRTVVHSARRTVNSAQARIIKEVINAASQGFDSDQGAAPRKISNMNKIYLPLIEKDFRNFNWGEVKRLIESEIKAKYAEKKNFTINETAVSRYEKSGSSFVIRAQSSVTYGADADKTHAVVETELSYIDYGKIEDNEKGIHALNCPNCGAPLTRNAAGELFCEYCSALTTGQKDWQITDIKEI